MATGVLLTKCFFLVVFCITPVLCGKLLWKSPWEFSNNIDDLIEDGEGKHWALLVAGSNGWDNYRHQADVCHSYQIMKKHGIPDERIVVMMYDDIADNEENPTPGIVINRPNGSDVYHGVPKDYTAEDVTPENFLSILSGDEEAMKDIGSGKVIKSGPNDHVFVYFADHGAPGIVAFPESELEARDLQKTIKKMHSQKKYAQMVFYIEACESGSMFKNLLPKNINVYATTAANGQESSYACYYDEKRDTYLGDVYSVKWMEDSDKENLDTETLHKQYEIVKKETNTSHVQQFGTQKISKEAVGDFQGGQQMRGRMNTVMGPNLAPVHFDAVPVEEVPMSILKKKYAKAESQTERLRILMKMNKQIQMREEVVVTVEKIVTLLTYDLAEIRMMLKTRQDLRNFDCYEPVVKKFSSKCFKIAKNLYALRQLYVFVNLCEANHKTGVILEAIDKTCSK